MNAAMCSDMLFWEHFKNTTFMQWQ